MAYSINLTSLNCGGWGALLQQLTVAFLTAEARSKVLKLDPDGLDIPRLNGSIAIDESKRVGWHSYFSSLEVGRGDESWPIGTGASLVATIVDYARALKSIYVLRPDLKDKIETAIQESGFTPEMNVVHIRRGDKVNPNPGSRVESGDLPLEEYLPSLPLDVPLYICTDDPSVVKFFQEAGYLVSYNKEEVRVQSKRMSGSLDQETALRDNFETLVNLEIMSRAKILVGGRMSYLFRTAELLRYPAPTINLKDNDVFGVAPYDLATPLVNPMPFKRYTEYRPQGTPIKKGSVWIVEDFFPPLNRDLAEVLSQPQLYFYRTIFPDTKGGVGFYRLDQEDVIAREKQLNMVNYFHKNHFCYSFLRTNNHHSTCVCIACRLRDTLGSYYYLRYFSDLVGEKITSLGESFLSVYREGDYLTEHHDKNKGKYAIVIYLNQDWKPRNGGVLRFDTMEVEPYGGRLVVFPIGINHYMTPVVGERVAFTGWLK